MHVLICGAGGQVGRALSSSAPAGTIVQAVAHADLDLADGHAVSGYIQANRLDVVINAAAYTAVDRAESEPGLAARVNTGGARNLALAVRETGARLIHISTDFVFDGTASLPYRPESATNPLSVYGATKLGGEQSVLEILPLNSVVLRTAWIYAAEGSNFVRTMLRLMKTRGSVSVVADQIGTPTSARSLAGAIWELTARPQITGIHHWTDAGVASWYDFAVAIAEEAAQLGLVAADVPVLPIRTDEYPTPARRPAYSVLDKRSLIELGLAPVHWRRSLRTILREIANA